eukprot:jgi/Mesvir1/2896/Mv13969-RA.1
MLHGARYRCFPFDSRYGTSSSTVEIYRECVSSLVEGLFEGFNATVLAYGQTGSGKTHTMAGGTHSDGEWDAGLLPLTVRHIFDLAELQRLNQPGIDVTIMGTAMEIYNDDLYDLAGGMGADHHGPGGNSKIAIRDTRTGTAVTGLHEAVVETPQQLVDFFSAALSGRATSATRMNDTSSRSHAICCVHVTQTLRGEIRRAPGGESEGADGSAAFARSLLSSMRRPGDSVVGKLNLVDLAGSERVKRSGVQGDQLKEASHINGGLLALGNVINALAEKSNAEKGAGDGKGTPGGSGASGPVTPRSFHIPYRSSKLTRILQDSLGGNSRTFLIACISACDTNFEETQNTLKYAHRACSIRNTPLINKFVLDEPHNLHTPQDSVMAAALKRYHKRAPPSRLRAHEYDRKRKEMLKLRGKNATFGLDESVLNDPVTNMPAQPSTAEDKPRTRKPTEDVREEEEGEEEDETVLEVRVELPESPPQASDERPASAGSNVSGGSSRRRQSWHVYLEEGEHDPELVEQAGGREPVEPSPLRTQATPAAASSRTSPPMSAENRASDGNAAASLATERAGVSPEGSTARTSPATSAASGPTHRKLWSADLSSIADDRFRVGGPGDNFLLRLRLPQGDVVTIRCASTRAEIDAVFELLGSQQAFDGSDRMMYLTAQLSPRVTPGGDANNNASAGEPPRRTSVSAGSSNGPNPSPRRVASSNNVRGFPAADGEIVGCLMASHGTDMVHSCIFSFQEPAELARVDVDARIELWGLQIVASDLSVGRGGTTSISLLLSLGLLQGLCQHVQSLGVSVGICVPRPELLAKWLRAGLPFVEIKEERTLIYPLYACDYNYYKSSTVAYFTVAKLLRSLRGTIEMELGELVKETVLGDLSR